MGKVYSIKKVQQLPVSLPEAWDFFSDPCNLSLLTPENLSLRVTNEVFGETMYAGQIITYLIRPVFNIPVFWLTEITQFRYQQYFIDEQRKGPYSLWHHEHHFTATEGGVLMTDIVYYALPAGFLGRIAHALWVKKQLAAIFDYRYQKIARHWPGKLTDDSSLAVDRWPKRDNG